jgi:hypothetical protein
MTSDRRTTSPNTDADPTTKKILAALRGLRFGSVEITVHEGRIVQIERKEKLRLNITCPDAAGEDGKDASG